MKIKATIIFLGHADGGVLVELKVPESEVRRLLAGEGPERSCSTCKHYDHCSQGSGDYDLCEPGEMNKYEPTSTTAKPPEAPPVEDKLALAREEPDSLEGAKTIYRIVKSAEHKTFPTLLEWDVLYNFFMAAIRERDERLSQMMTVEEVCKWNSKMTEEDENYDSYLRRRIKERNEGAGKK